MPKKASIPPWDRALSEPVLALPDAPTVGGMTTVEARYSMTYFAFSVLPAPDSPEMMMVWGLPRSMRRACASAATP